MRTFDAYTADPARPKWQEVLDDILSKLEAGDYPAGGDFPTLAALCLAYGISNITGRRVFRELQDRGLIATRGRRGTVVTHATQRQTVYMCFRDECFVDGREMLGNWWIYHEILMGLAGSDVAPLFDFKPVPRQFCLDHLDEFAGQPVIASADVLLRISDTEVRVDPSLVALLEKHLQPIYFHSYGGLAGVSAVGADLYACTGLPMAHLLAKGHRRIALLIGLTSSPWYQPRLQGYLDALHGAAVDFAPELVRLTSGKVPAEDQAAIEALLALPDPPTAVVCINDARALALLAWCRDRGIRVPDDLAVTGGDNRPETAFSRPALTTVDGRPGEVGRQVADLLARRLRGEAIPRQPILVAPRFIPRQST